MASTDGVGKRRRLFKLWEQDPCCYYCGCLTLLIFRPHGINMDSFRKVKNEATIEHLYSRLHPERGLRVNEEVTVLACWECNNKKNAEEEQKLPIEELRRRSGVV